jgi:hypothetical protein
MFETSNQIGFSGKLTKVVYLNNKTYLAASCLDNPTWFCVKQWCSAKPTSGPGGPHYRREAS